MIEKNEQLGSVVTEDKLDTEVKPVSKEDLDFNEKLNKAITSQLSRLTKKLEKEFQSKLDGLKPTAVESTPVVEDKDPVVSKLSELTSRIDRLTKENEKIKAEKVATEKKMKADSVSNKIASVMNGKVAPHIAELLIPRLMSDVNIDEESIKIGDSEFGIEEGVLSFLKSEKGSKYVTQVTPMKKVTTAVEKPAVFTSDDHNKVKSERQKAMETAEELRRLGLGL